MTVLLYVLIFIMLIAVTIGDLILTETSIIGHGYSDWCVAELPLFGYVISTCYDAFVSFLCLYLFNKPLSLILKHSKTTDQDTSYTHTHTKKKKIKKHKKKKLNKKKNRNNKQDKTNFFAVFLFCFVLFFFVFYVPCVVFSLFFWALKIYSWKLLFLFCVCVFICARVFVCMCVYVWLAMMDLTIKYSILTGVSVITTLVATVLSGFYCFLFYFLDWGVCFFYFFLFFFHFCVSFFAFFLVIFGVLFCNFFFLKKSLIFWWMFFICVLFCFCGTHTHTWMDI